MSKSKLKTEVIEKMATLITAGFGLVAALAWNDAIKSLFVEGGHLHFISVYGPWAYAVIITLMAVIATVSIARISGKAK